MKFNLPVLISGLALADASALIRGCDTREGPMDVASTTVGNGFDDSTITAKVEAALFFGPGAKGFDVTLGTRKGDIQRNGFGYVPLQIKRAIQPARGFPGVTSVNNKMTVKI